MNICSSCDYPTNDYTWKRQRIICRRCWELECRDEVMAMAPIVHISQEELLGEEE